MFQISQNLKSGIADGLQRTIAAVMALSSVLAAQEAAPSPDLRQESLPRIEVRPDKNSPDTFHVNRPVEITLTKENLPKGMLPYTAKFTDPSRQNSSASFSSGEIIAHDKFRLELARAEDGQVIPNKIVFIPDNIDLRDADKFTVNVSPEIYENLKASLGYIFSAALKINEAPTNRMFVTPDYPADIVTLGSEMQVNPSLDQISTLSPKQKIIIEGKIEEIIKSPNDDRQIILKVQSATGTEYFINASNSLVYQETLDLSTALHKSPQVGDEVRIAVSPSANGMLEIPWINSTYLLQASPERRAEFMETRASYQATQAQVQKLIKAQDYKTARLEFSQLFDLDLTAEEKIQVNELRLIFPEDERPVSFAKPETLASLKEAVPNTNFAALSAKELEALLVRYMSDPEALPSGGKIGSLNELIDATTLTANQKFNYYRDFIENRVTLIKQLEANSQPVPFILHYHCENAMTLLVKTAYENDFQDVIPPVKGILEQLFDEAVKASKESKLPHLFGEMVSSLTFFSQPMDSHNPTNFLAEMKESLPAFTSLYLKLAEAPKHVWLESAKRNLSKLISTFQQRFDALHGENFEAKFLEHCEEQSKRSPEIKLFLNTIKEKGYSIKLADNLSEDPLSANLEIIDAKPLAATVPVQKRVYFFLSNFEEQAVLEGISFEDLFVEIMANELVHVQAGTVQPHPRNEDLQAMAAASNTKTAPSAMEKKLVAFFKEEMLSEMTGLAARKRLSDPNFRWLQPDGAPTQEAQKYYQETSFHEFQAMGIQILQGENITVEKQILRTAMERFENLIKDPAVRNQVFIQLKERGY